MCFKNVFPHVTELVVYEIRTFGTRVTNLYSTGRIVAKNQIFFPWCNTHYKHYVLFLKVGALIVLTASQRLAYKNTFLCKLFSKGTATKRAQQCGDPELWLPLKAGWIGRPVPFSPTLLQQFCYTCAPQY